MLCLARTRLSVRDASNAPVDMPTHMRAHAQHQRQLEAQVCKQRRPFCVPRGIVRVIGGPGVLHADLLVSSSHGSSASFARACSLMNL
jgi:hypothetical protein